jgi:hypothetical protein
MANLSKLSDQDLIVATDSAVGREREVLINVLEHLREMDRRRLYSSLGYSSLWEYAVKRLRYSEDQAWRRISAMRMLGEIPELEEKIESGVLTLTNLGLAQSLFRSEAKSNKPLALEEKKAWLEQLENKSKREAEQVLLQNSHQPTRPDKVKAISGDQSVVQFTAHQDLLDKMERLKGLLAHSHPDLSLADLINKLCDMGLEKLDPARSPKRKPKPAPARGTSPKLRRRVAISRSVRREVFKRSESKCTKCGARHALQIEHIRPVAWKGTNELKNLTLLCRSCNQRSAIEKFGLDKMKAHLGKSDRVPRSD